MAGLRREETTTASSIRIRRVHRSTLGWSKNVPNLELERTIVSVDRYFMCSSVLVKRGGYACSFSTLLWLSEESCQGVIKTDYCCGVFCWKKARMCTVRFDYLLCTINQYGIWFGWLHVFTTSTGCSINIFQSRRHKKLSVKYSGCNDVSPGYYASLWYDWCFLHFVVVLYDSMLCYSLYLIYSLLRLIAQMTHQFTRKASKAQYQTWNGSKRHREPFVNYWKFFHSSA